MAKEQSIDLDKQLQSKESRIVNQFGIFLRACYKSILLFYKIYFYFKIITNQCMAVRPKALQLPDARFMADLLRKQFKFLPKRVFFRQILLVGR